jgi:hypothetical protein
MYGSSENLAVSIGSGYVHMAPLRGFPNVHWRHYKRPPDPIFLSETILLALELENNLHLSDPPEQGQSDANVALV